MNGENLIGKVLQNRYEIQEVIGIGGMAAVYKAHCRMLDRYVAVKILKPYLNCDPEILKRFKDESRSAASLSHRNIVSIFDVGEEDGLNYIVMELVEGITLKEYISGKGCLSWKEACDIAGQIGIALQCAHDNNIIHRDIKPHNILITKDKEIKVADFGIARAVTSETLDAGKETMGSVRYISPEQARGGYVDAKSDVYSLGVVLYEMLTGKVPFDGDNPVSIAMMKLNNEPIDCRIVNPDIPVFISNIVMKAIAMEQHKRYHTANEMVADLKYAFGMSGNKENDSDANRRSDVYRGRRKDKKKKKRISLKMLITGAAVIAVLLGFISYFSMSGGKKEVIVPDIINMTYEEAVETVKLAGLRIDEEGIEYETSDEVEEGRIILQDPGANQYMNDNKKIKIIVSMGKEEGNIPVPELVGKSYDTVIDILNTLKLVPEKFEEESEAINKGYVIRQSPASGVNVHEGHTVVVYVSTGSDKEINVPAVVGDLLDDAKKKLTDSGFKVSVTQKESDDDIEGTVLSQKPLAGEGIKEGSTVSIAVAVKPAVKEPAPTPEVTPTPTPTPPTPTSEPRKRKTISIQIPENANDEIQLRVVANGKTIHDEKHKKSEGTVDIPVEAKNDATVEAYIDGVMVMKRVIEF